MATLPCRYPRLTLPPARFFASFRYQDAVRGRASQRPVIEMTIPSCTSTLGISLSGVEAVSLCGHNMSWGGARGQGVCDQPGRLFWNVTRDSFDAIDPLGNWWAALDNTLAPPGHHVVQLFTQYTPYAPTAGPWDDRSRNAYAHRCFDVVEEYVSCDHEKKWSWGGGVAPTKCARRRVAH